MLDISSGRLSINGTTYVINADYTGSESSATDNASALHDLIAYAGINPGSLSVDNGGSIGDMILLPKGSILVGQPLVMPYGVGMAGSNDLATTLMMKSTFDQAANFIDLGDSSYHMATFGGRLKNLQIEAPPTLPANWATSMVSCTNVQDTDAILDGVRILGFNRCAFKGEKGWGGASTIKLRRVFALTTKAGLPAINLNYGESCLIELDGVGVAGGRDPSNPNNPNPGTIGMVCSGGLFNIRNLHAEVVDTGVLVNLVSATGASAIKSYFRMEWSTGGPVLNNLVVVANNSLQVGHIELEKVWRNGAAQHTVLNGQNGASHIDGDIIAKVVL